MLAIVGLAIGIVIGLVLDPTVPTWLVPYLPIAVVAAMDALLGGLRARLQGVFDDQVFITSFLFNTVVAAFLVYVGDQLGVGGQMTTAIVVVLGIRIFSNVAAIRRHIFKA
ncbi:small basic family protein [Georgenia sp. Z1344]|uniref:small basic family protein n=1 Tax=Georgenia sp. Z1344 TaxID=3416706 RepID=UPI003CEA8F52